MYEFSTGRLLLVDRFDVHANRVHKRGFTRPFPSKTGRHPETIDGYDHLRRQLVCVSRERVVDRSRQNYLHGFLFRVQVDNVCRRRWCVWELTHAKNDPPPEAVASLLEATSFWGVAPLLMRAQSLDIPSVLEGAWTPGCVWLGVLPGAIAPRDDATTLWNWVKYRAKRTEVSGTGLMFCRSDRSVWYRYRCCTDASIGFGT